MKLYSGIDLHSTNSFLAIIDENAKRIFKEKLPNKIVAITERLSLYSRWPVRLMAMPRHDVVLMTVWQNPVTAEPVDFLESNLFPKRLD